MAIDSYSHDIDVQIIYSHDIDARLTELDAAYASADEPSAWEEEHGDEYAALTTFRDSVLDVYGRDAWERGLSFVADDYWEDYAAEQARDIYGEATGTPYWDDSQWASDLQEGFTAFLLENTIYWGDGSK